jgi:hypothetical protein
MNGLFEFLKTPTGQGLIAAGFGGLAGARRGTPLNNIGRAGLAGLTGYASALDRTAQEQQAAEQAELRKLQVQQTREGLLTAQQQRELAAQRARQEEERRKLIPTLFQGRQTGGDVVAPEMGGIPMFSQGSTMTPVQTVGRDKFDVQRALEAGFTPEEIEKYAKIENVGKPRVARTVKKMGQDGREYEVQLDEFGQEVGSPFAQFRAPLQIDAGGRVVFADPYTRQEIGGIGKTMSPGERDASARGWATVRQGQQRLSMDAKGDGGKAPTGYRWKADGSGLEPIPGGPAADKTANLTEGERKAATLLKRMDGSIQQMEAALQKNPGAAKPGVIASVMPLDVLGNLATGPERQRVEAAQLDILDAALTLGTGAAYTKEQLEGYRKAYFPQIGDSQATIKDKRDRLNNVLDSARVAAGRAAPAATGPKPLGPAATPEQQRLLNLYGG